MFGKGLGNWLSGLNSCCESMRTRVWISRTHVQLGAVLCACIQCSQCQMKSEERRIPGSYWNSCPGIGSSKRQRVRLYLKQGRKWGLIIEVISWSQLVCCRMDESCTHIHAYTPYTYIYIHTHAWAYEMDLCVNLDTWVLFPGVT